MLFYTECGGLSGADEGSWFRNEICQFRDELRDIAKTLVEIREELATQRTDMVWVKGITEGVCTDIEDLQAFKWRLYGMSAGISACVGVAMRFLWG